MGVCGGGNGDEEIQNRRDGVLSTEYFYSILMEQRDNAFVYRKQGVIGHCIISVRSPKHHNYFSTLRDIENTDVLQEHISPILVLKSYFEIQRIKP